jgi:hypothetical protein
MPNITDAASQRIRVGRRRHPKIRVIGHMKVPSAPAFGALHGKGFLTKK